MYETQITFSKIVSNKSPYTIYVKMLCKSHINQIIYFDPHKVHTPGMEITTDMEITFVYGSSTRWQLDINCK